MTPPNSAQALVEGETMKSELFKDAIQIFAGGQEVMRITKGKIWVNPEVETDEAARKVLEALQELIDQQLTSECEKVKRLVGMLKFVRNHGALRPLYEKEIDTLLTELGEG